MTLPSYEQLKTRTDAPAGSSWGLLGDLGTVGRLGRDQTLRGLSCVRDGRVFSLDWPINAFDPPVSPSRRRASHHIFQRHENHRDDYLDSFFPQATSQVDGLRHQRYRGAGFYNFAPDQAIEAGGGPIGIEQWADHGIVGRGVLIDVERHLHETRGTGLDQAGGEAFGPEVLDAALARQGVGVEEGDIVLIRTGWSEFYFSALTPAQRGELPRHIVSPGLRQGDDALEWLWDSSAALIAADNAAVEAVPAIPESPYFAIEDAGMMHPAMIALLGCALGELWRLDDLAQACAADERYDMLVCVKPLCLPGGVGSPANALAVR